MNFIGFKKKRKVQRIKPKQYSSFTGNLKPLKHIDFPCIAFGRTFVLDLASRFGFIWFWVLFVYNLFLDLMCLFYNILPSKTLNTNKNLDIKSLKIGKKITILLLPDFQFPLRCDFIPNFPFLIFHRMNSWTHTSFYHQCGFRSNAVLRLFNHNNTKGTVNLQKEKKHTNA